MLNHSYDKLEDIPQEKRGAYVLKDGKYVLDELEAQHPLVVKKTQLKSEVSTKQGTITRLTNEKAALEGKTLADGQVAVTADEKLYIDTLKPYGLPKEIKGKLDKFPDLERRDSERTRNEHLTQVAGVMGWKPEALIAIAEKLPKLEIRDLTENGQVVKDEKGDAKKKVVAILEGANNTTSEKNFREHFNATPELKIFEPSLSIGEGGQMFEGTELPPMGTGGGGDKLLSDSILSNTYDMSWQAAGSGAGTSK